MNPTNDNNSNLQAGGPTEPIRRSALLCSAEIGAPVGSQAIRNPRLVSPEVWMAEGVVGDVVGVDFETFYTGDYSVSSMGTWAYCRDPRFDAYLVAVADGEKVCVCRPEEFPWGSIAGLEWVSHNREFDRYVFERLFAAEAGRWNLGDGVGCMGPRQWHCSAAVCAFLQLPRDLAGAVEEVYGVTLDKTVRARAKARPGRADTGYGIRDKCQGVLDLGDGGVDEEMLVYAARDAVACLALWLRLGEKWPARERRLFEVSCEMGRRGLAIDWGYVAESRRDLVRQVEGLKASLPWVPSLSIPKFKAACEVVGVPAPASTDGDDPRFLAWLEEHRDTPAGAWARTLGAVRSGNRTEKVLASMLARRCRASRPGLASRRCREGIEEEVEGDRMVFELKYCGANTGRWSGGGGLNLQNLNRSEAEGVDLRRAIVAAPGYVLAAVDFSQIEARVLLWLAGDHGALGMLVVNPAMDLYEVHARATMGFGAAEPRGVGSLELGVGGGGMGQGAGGMRNANAEHRTANAERPMEGESLKAFCTRTGSTLRQLAKARVLGLGFGCGAEKFVAVAKSMADLDITLAESEGIVREYRESNPLVVGLWRRLEDAARSKVGGDYVLPLPCTGADRSYGRFLFYRGLRRRGRELVCRVGGQETKIYGGLLAENWTQATARDVLAEAWLRCVDAGFVPVLSVHDELVFELPEASAEAELARIVGIMEEPVSWAPTLPLKAEGSLMNFYQK